MAVPGKAAIPRMSADAASSPFHHRTAASRYGESFLSDAIEAGIDDCAVGRDLYRDADLCGQLLREMVVAAGGLENHGIQFGTGGSESPRPP